MSEVKENDVVKRFRFSEESWEYIQEYARKNNIPYNNRVINYIVEEHKEFTSLNEDKEQEFVERISEKISKEINDEIRRIRLGTNNTDRNTQIIIELLNSYFVQNDINSLISTADMKNEALKLAEDAVQKRIQKQKQKRDERTQRR